MGGKGYFGEGVCVGKGEGFVWVREGVRGVWVCVCVRGEGECVFRRGRRGGLWA